MLDDRDHRSDASNASLTAALRELDRERPERVAALFGVLMFSFVALASALVALAVLK